ncbi:MAG: pyridoxal-dependent decarboxylase, partial [Pseudomonadota bacterium]
MKLTEFRAHAHRMVDWMADYLEKVEEYPVRSQVSPGDIKSQLPKQPPQKGEPMDRIFSDFESVVMPGITHWQSPNFFAYFTANSSPPSILAEMLTATLGAQCMLWQTSPAASEMEDVVTDWLRQAMNLPDEFKGVIQDSATSATLVALLTAREKATNYQGNDKGLFKLGQSGDSLTVYCSEEAHSSVEKGLKIAGFGKENFRKIQADSGFAMDLPKLEAQIVEDKKAGHKPTIVVASIGGTSVGAVDDLTGVGEICQRHNVWLHVDAAWAGSAMILPELQHHLKGARYMDSFVFNPHKWLLTNFDCSVYFIKDPVALEKTLALIPEYLKSPEGRTVTDYQNWSVPLGRRFRALKLWFVIRSYGMEGLRSILRNHLLWAEEVYTQVSQDPDFEILSPLRFTLFSFRFAPEGVDEAKLTALNEQLVNTVNDRGHIYIT